MTNYGAEEPWPLPPKASSSRLRFLSNLASTLEFYWVLPDFTRFYRVLPGFTGFYRVLPSFDGFLLGLIGFCKVFLGLKLPPQKNLTNHINFKNDRYRMTLPRWYWKIKRWKRYLLKQLSESVAMLGIIGRLNSDMDRILPGSIHFDCI